VDLWHSIRQLAPHRRSRNHRHRHPLDHPPSETKTSRRTLIIPSQTNIQYQIQADLKWIIDSPPLFDGADGLNALIESGTEGSPQLPFVETSSQFPVPRRVGLYFESLLDLWLTHGLKLDVEARHCQIFDGKRTVGEIDFCLQDRNGHRWHLESTIKFYLHHPSTASTHGSSFIGPDPRDSFERKHQHLMQRQLKLSIPELSPVDHALPISRGMLFYHLEEPNHTDRPKGAHPEHLRGIWLRASEWRKVSPLKIDQIVNLPKPYWLSGLINPGITSEAMTWQEAGIHIQSHFQKSKSPLMLSLRSGENGPALETQRCIVIHDTWPES